MVFASWRGVCIQVIIISIISITISIGPISNSNFCHSRYIFFHFDSVRDFLFLLLMGALQCQVQSCCSISKAAPSECSPQTLMHTYKYNPRDFPRAKGRGKSRGGRGWIFQYLRVLVEYGQSLSINLSTGSGSANPSLWSGKD